ncbi:MAG: hypothetical protein HY560_08990, partial [Gemmatimonadetes bacterium]|nr:hypothetical protein [Gemmatimonadota bacterium]
MNRAFFLTVLATVLAAACSGATLPRLTPDTPVPAAVCPAPQGPRLAFRSSFWLNLHNFLHKEAKRRARIDDDGAGARGNIAADTIGVRQLSAGERPAWEQTLDFYATTVLTGRVGGGDSLVIRINDRLADADGDQSPMAAAVDSALAVHLVRVAPIYRAVWWPIHDRRNQSWIAATEQLVDRYAGCVFPRAEQVLGAPWPAALIRADATVYASWAGAYSTSVNGPHITMSTNAAGYLET